MVFSIQRTVIGLGGSSVPVPVLTLQLVSVGCIGFSICQSTHNVEHTIGGNVLSTRPVCMHRIALDSASSNRMAMEWEGACAYHWAGVYKISVFLHDASDSAFVEASMMCERSTHTKLCSLWTGLYSICWIQLVAKLRWPEMGAYQGFPICDSFLYLYDASDCIWLTANEVAEMNIPVLQKIGADTI